MNGKLLHNEVPETVRRPVRPLRQRPIPGAGGITGREILRILRKRKWLIIMSVVICTVLTFAGTLLWYLMAPLYTASAYIRVEAPKGTAMRGVQMLPPTAVMDRLLMTHAQLVRTEQVLQDAINDPRVRNSYWYKKHQKDRVKELFEEISVGPVPNTYFIVVSMTDFAPGRKEKSDLANIVNAVAGMAVEHMQRIAVSGYRGQSGRFRDEIDGLTARLTGIRSTIERQTTELGENPQALLAEFAALARQKAVLEMEKQEVETLYEQVEAQSEEELANSPQVRGMVESDPGLQMLRREETNLEILVVSLRNAGFGPRHRAMSDIEIRLAKVREKIQTSKEQLTIQAVGTYRGVLKMDAEAKKARLVAATERYNETKASLTDLQAKLDEQKESMAEAEVLRERIELIEARVVDINLLQGDPQVKLARFAEIPRDPSHPRWRIMMPLGVFVGLIIGLGITFLLEFIDTSIKSPSDLARRVDLPLLGMVPHTDDLEEEIGDLHLAFGNSPNSLIGEAFRQIRTCLLFSGPAETQRSLLVTSPLPQDGRGTVTMNLAASMGHGGRRVLVVDANFRQPMIRKLFPQSPEGGLSSALVGQGNWRDLIYEVEPNFFVMSAGPMPPNPAELLGSAQMRQLVAELVEEFDQVFFDGAPALVVTDSAVLSTLLDGVILVVRAGMNTHGIVQKTRDMLTRVGAHIVGVVLNGVRVTAGGYLRKNYETFYAYHDQLVE